MTEEAQDKFVEYYEQASISDRAIQRFQSIKDVMLGVRRAMGLSTDQLEVVDIGCNAGTQSIMWAKQQHKVRGLDINDGLVSIAKLRAEEQGVNIDFRVGSATQLPWNEQVADICILPELLEHVEDWQSCLDEGIRMMKPNGTLYLSTTNVLCPKQQEFDLPFYSWYPAPLKRHLEKLSVTTKRHWVNYAEYPAVHWFSFFQLKKYLEKRGFSCKDRFDIIVDTADKSSKKYQIAKIICSNPILRWLGHVATPYTVVIAVKESF